jgi:hypothetical protein
VQLKTPSYADALDELERGEAHQLRSLIGGWQVDTATVRRLPRGEAADGTADSVADVLDVAFDRAGRVPMGVPLLMLYVLYECEQAWEVSYRYDTIQATLRAVSARWRVGAQVATDLVAAALSALDLLDNEMNVEHAVITSSLLLVASSARQAQRLAHDLSRRAAAARTSDHRIAEYLATRADTATSYYGPLATAAVAANRFLREPDGSLDAAIDALRGCEQGWPSDDDERRSELRANRASLTALAARASEEWLSVDRAKLIYVYPFGIRGADPATVVEQAAREGDDWDLAGIRSAGVRDWFGVDDMWQGADFHRRRFEGVTVELPPVELADSTGAVLGRLDGEVRLSRLGNHAVRLQGVLENAGPQEIYAALRRAAPTHGAIRVTCGQRDFPRLAELAAELIDAVTNRFLDTPTTGRRGICHVIVSTADVSLGQGPACPADQRRVVTDARTVVDVAGAPALLRPVVNTVGSMAEWSRYPVSRGDIIEGVGCTGDLLVRTCNTTVLVMPGSPSFLRGMYEGVAEFVATLEGLFASWDDELISYYNEVAGLSQERAVQTAGHQELNGLRVRLQDFVANARSILALVSSPALVGSPVDAETVARFLAAAGFDRVREDFNSKVEQVLHDRLRRADAAEQELRRRRDRKQQARLNTVLAVIAAAGVSGLAQVLQQGFDWKGAASLILFGVVVAVAIGVGLVWALVDR